MKKCLFPIDAYVVWCLTWLKNLGRYLLQTFSQYKYYKYRVGVWDHQFNPFMHLEKHWLFRNSIASKVQRCYLFPKQNCWITWHRPTKINDLVIKWKREYAFKSRHNLLGISFGLNFRRVLLKSIDSFETLASKGQRW